MPGNAVLEKTVRQAVRDVAITDIHTHLFPPSHGKLMLWGADELLTYHYLVAELFTVAPRSLTPQAFWRLTKRQQADLVWEHVFTKHGPLSEAARGVITVFNALGLDVAGERQARRLSHQLTAIRAWFATQELEKYLPKVLKLANVQSLVMTNNPFVEQEAACWRLGLPVAQGLRPALRIDPLLVNWPSAAKNMKEQGYATAARPTAKGLAQARKFLMDWAKRIGPVYLAASLGPDFAYPSRSTGSMVLREVVLPVARDLNVPLALMIGVRKGLNPDLGDGGDGVGPADVQALVHLCQENPDVKFLSTMLWRGNQHELCVAARKFRNLHVFGCWWFCNTPSIIREMTAMRLELLGTAFTCQHSDARVLEQVIYKWSHAREVVADVLVEKYEGLRRAGWQPTVAEIRRDVQAIFGGSFEQFVGG